MVEKLKMNNKNKLDISDDESGSHGGDSDAELMAALRTGAIQPGSLITSSELKKSREVVNNTAALEQYIAQTTELINKDGVDLLSEFAEFPCVTIQEDEKREASAEEHAQKTMHNLANDDFKREALFAMEAKASILQAFDKLKDLDIPIGRPDDFYAEMAKTDTHMEKVKSKIISKKDEQERREKLRKLREQRKHGKQVQQEVAKKRAAEKAEFQKKIKRAKKDKTGDALFDDDEGKGGKAKKTNFKRAHKDQKFGKAWGDKLRTATQNNAKKGKFAPKGTGRHPNKMPGKKGGKPVAKKRPGKNERSKAKR